MTYTQADADAAKAKIAADTAALPAQQKAVTDAQALVDGTTRGVTTAEADVAAAQAALDSATSQLAAAQDNATNAAAALVSAKSTVAATKADIATEQAIVDAFNAQPPPVTVPATPVDRTMFPDAPLPPVGPFTEKQQFHVDTATDTLTISKRHFTDDYTSVQINQQVGQLNMSDCVGDNVGSFVYTAAGAGGVTNAKIERVLGNKQKAGRPAFRLYGPANVFELNDIDITFDGINTNTGDIGTGFQLAEKYDRTLTDPALIAADRAKRQVTKIIGTRWHISQIKDGPKLDSAGNPTTSGWQPKDYWNGDGATSEESALELALGHLYMHDITDGGVDFKAPGTIEFLRSERCRAGAKLWASMHIKRFICLDPTLQGGIGGVSVLRLQGHKTNPPVYQIDNSYIDSDKLIVDIENGPVELRITGKIEGSGSLVPRLNNGGLLLPSSVLNGSAFPTK